VGWIRLAKNCYSANILAAVTLVSSLESVSVH
jgi:hypothetical protein